MYNDDENHVIQGACHALNQSTHDTASGRVQIFQRGTLEISLISSARSEEASVKQLGFLLN